MSKIEQLVDDFLSSYRYPNSIQLGGLNVNTEWGGKSKLIFENYDIETFEFADLTKLAGLITKELVVEISQDHFTFWSWCGHVVFYCIVDGRMKKQLPSWFRDDITHGFRAIVNLLLAVLNKKRLDYADRLFIELVVDSFTIIGPFTFSVLEGLLRRLNSSFVNKDGSVITTFSITRSNGSIILYNAGKKRKLNQTGDSLRLFEDCTVKRGFKCEGLDEIKKEILNLFGASEDPYDLINEWRNDEAHGNQYSKNTCSVILNLICILLLDVIGPRIYNSNLINFQQYAESKRERYSNLEPWEIYITKN